MRNLKRALSLALASVMVIGMMVVGAGAVSYDDFSDKDEIVNTEAVSTLVSLNVIAGKDDGSYDPSGIVTRAEMAKMICVVLNGGKDPQLGTVSSYSYTDTVGHWAAAYIEYCTTLGIVAGDGTGNFFPTATVTGAQAAKMLLVAAGYQASIEGFTGANWANAVNVRANQVGLYDQLAINPSEGLSRDNAAQMVYNVLDVNMVTYEYTLVTNGGAVTSIPSLEEGTKTVLQDRFNAVKVEAVVVANEFASLSSSSGSAAKDEGYTQFAVKSTSDGVSGTYKVSTPVEYLGQTVTMFVKYKTAGTDNGATVIGNPILSDSNKLYTTVDGTSVEDAIDDNDVSLDKDVEYFNNYKGEDAVTPVKGGTLTLIDNNNDDEVDFVLYNQYDAGIVTYYSTKDKGTIKVTTDGKTYDYDKSSNVVGFDDVEKDDYVLVIEYGGKLYVEKPETVTGELTAYSNSKKNAKVEGTTYSFSGIKSNVGSDLDKIADYVGTDVLDVSATFYLDNNGYVLAVGEAEDANLQYAVLLAYQDKTAANAGSLGTDAKVKVLLADGSTATYVVDSLDGDDIEANAFATAHYGIGDVFSYTLNNDDEIRMSIAATVKTVTGAGEGTKIYTSGKASINNSLTDDDAQSGVVTADTVFLYKKDGKTTRFVGKADAPDLSVANGATLNMTIATKNSKAVLVYVEAAPSADFDGNYLYVYDTRAVENSDGYEISVLMNGEKATITIANDASQVNKNMEIAKGVYAFSKDADDIYTLTQSSTNYTTYVKTAGEATVVESDYAIIGGKEYAITNDTLVSYSKEGKDSATESAVLSEGDTADIVINDDDEIVYIFITKYAESGSSDDNNTPSDFDGDTTVVIDGDTAKVTYYGSVSASKIASILRDQDPTIELIDTTGVDMVPSDTNPIIITYANGTTSKVYLELTQMFKVTLTGVTAKIGDDSVAAGYFAKDTVLALTSDATTENLQIKAGEDFIGSKADGTNAATASHTVAADVAFTAEVNP